MLNATQLANGEAVSRHQIEQHIQSLIDLLDALDGDPDLEEEPDDESYLADDRFSTGLHIDMEVDTCDCEPWLGWSGAIAQKGLGWLGDVLGDDREWDGDDLEPDADDEARLQPPNLQDVAA